MEIVTGMIVKTDEAKQVGFNTLAALGAQRDQIGASKEAVIHMDSELKLASRQIRVFARRMVTDKIILGMVALILIAVLVVIIIIAVKPTATTVVNTAQSWIRN